MRNYKKKVIWLLFLLKIQYQPADGKWKESVRGIDILYFWPHPWDTKFFLWHFSHIYLEHDKYIYPSNYINTRSLFYLSSGALCCYVGGKADSFLLLPRDE